MKPRMTKDDFELLKRVLNSKNSSGFSLSSKDNSEASVLDWERAKRLLSDQELMDSLTPEEHEELFWSIRF